MHPLPRTSSYRIHAAPDVKLAYFRDALLGAVRYGHESGRLVFQWPLIDNYNEAQLRRMIETGAVDGILASIHERRLETFYTSLGVPVVNISNAMFAPRCPVVTQNDVLVGRSAAEHLQSCGCEHFVFWGEENSNYSEERRAGFVQALAPRQVVEGFSKRHNETNGQRHERIRSVVAKLPPKTGIFAVMDDYALSFLRSARELGRSVPQELAVLGAGDEGFLVELEPTPLSSIQLPSRSIGYEAGRLLDQMISRKTLLADSVRVSHCQVIARRSTDVSFHEDAAIKAVLSHLKQHPGASVAELVDIAGLSRTSLQGRFKKACGHTMLEYVQNQRLSLAKELLSRTNERLEDIALKVGISSAQRFNAVFKRHTGFTPGMHRKTHRKSSGL